MAPVYYLILCIVTGSSGDDILYSELHTADLHCYRFFPKSTLPGDELR